MLQNNLKKLRVTGTFMSASDVAREVSQLSERTISMRQMSQYESNLAQPSLVLHKAFARALNCSVEDLFTLVPSKKPLNHHHKSIADFYKLNQ